MSGTGSGFGANYGGYSSRSVGSGRQSAQNSRAGSNHKTNSSRSMSRDTGSLPPTPGRYLVQLGDSYSGSSRRSVRNDNTSSWSIGGGYKPQYPTQGRYLPQSGPSYDGSGPSARDHSKISGSTGGGHNSPPPTPGRSLAPWGDSYSSRRSSRDNTYPRFAYIESSGKSIRSHGNYHVSAGAHEQSKNGRTISRVADNSPNDTGSLYGAAGPDVAKRSRQSHPYYPQPAGSLSGSADIRSPLPSNHHSMPASSSRGDKGTARRASHLPDNYYDSDAESRTSGSW